MSTDTDIDAPEFEVAREVCILIDTLPDAKRRQVMALLVARYDLDPRDLLLLRGSRFKSGHRFKPRGG